MGSIPQLTPPVLRGTRKRLDQSEWGCQGPCLAVLGHKCKQCKLRIVPTSSLVTSWLKLLLQFRL